MPVETLHPDYERHEKKARRVRDAVEGSDAIKRRGTDYLPALIVTGKRNLEGT